MPVSQIEQVPVGQLKPHPSNVHTHSKKQIAKIARSIGQFDFIVPIVRDPRGFILAGHGRWLAAKQRGMSHVPVVTVSGLSEVETRAYILADNKLTEQAGWNRAGLVAELNELAPLLAEAGLDLELTSFEAAEVDSLLGDLSDPETDPADEVPLPAEKPVSAPGDLWGADDHRLLCGDAKNPPDLRKLMGRERAAMVFTDPPFNLKIRSVQGRGKTKHREFAQASGEMSARQFTVFLLATLGLVAKYSADGAIAFVCMDWRHVRELLDAGEQVFGTLKNLIVWAKTHGGMGTFYRSQHELIFVFKNGDAPHTNNFQLGQFGRNRSNVWTYAGVNTFRTGRLDDLGAHPTVKPVAMVADAMKDCSRRGDIVLDPFMGSGTTILAAEKVGRRGYGLEIDPLYVDVAIRRWQSLTKRDAILTATGQTFDEVAAARTEAAEIRNDDAVRRASTRVRRRT
jgi:DNA modification methylase